MSTNFGKVCYSVGDYKNVKTGPQCMSLKKKTHRNQIFYITLFSGIANTIKLPTWVGLHPVWTGPTWHTQMPRHVFPLRTDTKTQRLLWYLPGVEIWLQFTLHFPLFSEESFLHLPHARSASRTHCIEVCILEITDTFSKFSANTKRNDEVRLRVPIISTVFYV